MIISENTNYNYFSASYRTADKRKISADAYEERKKESEIQRADDNPNRKTSGKDMETETQVFTNPEGAKILMIKTSFGVRYVKLTEENL